MGLQPSKPILISFINSGCSLAGLGLAMLIGFSPVFAHVVTSNAVQRRAKIAPPVFPSYDVIESFFDTTVHDPYRALENTADPAVNQWMRAQDDYARDVLSNIPNYAKILHELYKYESSVPVRVAGLSRTQGDLWFYERRGKQDNQFKLFQRRGLYGEERLLVDPSAEERRTGKPHVISYYFTSNDGRILAYGLSAEGSESANLFLMDTISGSQLGHPISRAEFGDVRFSMDGGQVIFNRLMQMSATMPETDKYKKSRVYLMRIGAPLDSAKPVFGFGVPGVEIDPASVPSVTLTTDGHWAIGKIANGVQKEFGLYLSPAKAFLDGKPKWVSLFDSSAKVVGFAYHRDVLYLRTHAEAPRYRLMSLNLADLNLGQMSDIRSKVNSMPVVVPETEQVIVEHVAAADGLYVERRDGNSKRLYRLAYNSKSTRLASLQEVKLPFSGTFNLSEEESGTVAANPLLPGLILELWGKTRARQIYLLDRYGRIINTDLQPRGPFDTPDNLVATEVMVASHDGTMVPMSLLHRKGLVRDGKNPTMIWGYAAYGATEALRFSTGLLPFLDAGGVIAVVNPRGSGVYGENWYRGGFQATKPNTWKDIIACAEWLHAQKYSSPQTLGLSGASAGGILVGRAVTERPDLFAVAVVAVGTLDMIRAETMSNGVPNIPEHGSRKTKAGFDALLAMSTYHHIHDDVKYPALLFIHGVNDPRVDVWQSSKTAARLAASTISGKPVLLRLEWDSGHGWDTKRQELEELASTYAFMLWQMGLSEPQRD